MNKITIYGFAKGDRSGRVLWTLEELGISTKQSSAGPWIVEHIKLDDEKNDHKAPAYLEMNPMGRSPTMKMGDFVMHESTACCLFLADHFAHNPQTTQLAPPTTSPLRGLYYQWSVFASATMEPIFSKYWELLETADRTTAKRITTQNLKPVVTTLERTLRHNHFLVGNAFSIADIMVASCLGWTKGTVLEMSSVLGAYYDRMRSRPAALNCGYWDGK